MWRKARDITEIKLFPRDLKFWFCSEMGRLGVPDRYIDGFCGRVPQRVIARHYTDYSPETLKESMIRLISKSYPGNLFI